MTQQHEFSAYKTVKAFHINDVIFPSGCEVRALNLGNKNMKIGIFTVGTSVRSKNIFTDISRYPTGKHEIKHDIFYKPSQMIVLEINEVNDSTLF